MKKPTTPNPVLVADDNGYADHKIAIYDADGKIVCTKIATNIQIGGTSLASVSGETDPTYSSFDAEGNLWNTYTCSTSISAPLNLRNDEYPFVEANRVLAHHAMVTAGLGGKKVDLAITLPFRDFYNNKGERLEGIHEKTLDNFRLNNIVDDKTGLKIEVASAKVFPEGMCAFYDWALAEDGSTSEGYDELDQDDGSFLVVDIGGSTTDIVCIRMVGGDIKIDHQFSGTEKLGVNDVKEGINSSFQSRIGVGHESGLSHRAIQRIMEKGFYKVGGQTIEMGEDVALIMRSVTARIINYVKSKAGQLSQYQGILFVGGGAVVFQDALKGIVPNGIVGDEFANARGMLKYMKAGQQ